MPLPTNAGKTTFYHPIFKPAKSSDVRAAARNDDLVVPSIAEPSIHPQ